MERAQRINLHTAHLGTISLKERSLLIKDRVAQAIMIVILILHTLPCSAVMSQVNILPMAKYVIILQAVYHMQAKQQHQQLLLSLTFLAVFAFFALLSL